MLDALVPIERVKRDISNLIHRVARRGERIILTSRGKPRAALVSIEDYERLKQGQANSSLARWQAWLDQADALVAEVMARRGGATMSVDDLLCQERKELEARSDWVASSH